MIYSVHKLAQNIKQTGDIKYLHAANTEKMTENMVFMTLMQMTLQIKNSFAKLAFLTHFVFHYDVVDFSSFLFKRKNGKYLSK